MGGKGKDQGIINPFEKESEKVEGKAKEAPAGVDVLDSHKEATQAATREKEDAKAARAAGDVSGQKSDLFPGAQRFGIDGLERGDKKAAASGDGRSPEEKRIAQTAHKVVKEADKDGDGHVTMDELKSYQQELMKKEDTPDVVERMRVASLMMDSFKEMQKASRDDSKLGFKKEKGITDADVDAYSKKLADAYPEHWKERERLSPGDEKKAHEKVAADVKEAASSHDLSKVIEDVEKARDTMHPRDYAKYLDTVTREMRKAGILAENQEVVGAGDGELAVWENVTRAGTRRGSGITHYDAKGNDVKDDAHEYANLFMAPEQKAAHEADQRRKEAESSVDVSIAGAKESENLSGVISNIEKARKQLGPDQFKEYLKHVDKELHEAGILPPRVHIDADQYAKGEVKGLPVEHVDDKGRPDKHTVLDAKGKDTKGVKGIPDAFTGDTGEKEDAIDKRTKGIVNPFDKDASVEVEMKKGETLNDVAAAAIQRRWGSDYKPTKAEVAMEVERIAKANGIDPKDAFKPFSKDTDIRIPLTDE
jgi:hypothetical protein